MNNSPIGSEPGLRQSMSHVRDTVVEAIRSGASAVCVTGGPPSARTTLCRDLAAGIDDRSFTTAIADPTLGPDAVLLQLLNDFGLTAGPPPDAGHVHETLSGALVRFLRSLRPLGAHALVLIDDADQVGAEVFGALLSVSRAAGADAHLLRLVLIGPPALGGRLAAPPLSEFPTTGSWTTLTLTGDDVPAPLTPTEAPDLAVEAPLRERARARSAVAPLAALFVVLLVVAAAAWIWMSTRAPVAPPRSAAPALPSVGASDSGLASAPASPAPAPAAPTATPPAAAVPVAESTTGSGPYRITVASFRTSARAQQVASELQQQQLTVATRVDATGVWHQVVAGPFVSIETAREAQRLLDQAGFPDTQISVVPATSAR